MARPLKYLFFLLLLILFAITSFFFFSKSRPIQPAQIKSPSPAENNAIILPHLDTAKTDRVNFLKSIKNTNPTNIFIFSTNHFASSSNDIVFDNSDWTQSQGTITGNAKIKESFSAYEISHDLVVGDHGIRNPISDLYEVFPKAQYSNFLIKAGTSDQSIDELLSKISSYCSGTKKSCLVAGSVDMSHYCPSQIADFHDQFTISALKNQSEEKIKKAETDSPEVLELLVKWAKFNKLNSFDVFSQNNSGKLAGDYEGETTSWIIGQFGKFDKKPEENFELMFAGDIMMDRSVNHQYQNNGFEKIFQNFPSRVFAGVDASVANLEGPVNDGPVDDDETADNLIFNFPLNSLDALSFINLDGFSLANNHTLNDSKAGLDRTRKILKEKNFFSFGSPDKIDDYSLYKLNSNAAVSLIGVNVLSGFDRDSLKAMIEGEKSTGQFVIVFPHWGSEYATSHNSSQESLAHLMVDSGADLVVGSHPHVVQDSEIYKGKLIAYSLGNFVFDQLFSAETQRGAILSVSATGEKIKVGFTPIVSKKIKVELAKGEEKQAILDRVVAGLGFIKKGEDGTIELER